MENLNDLVIFVKVVEAGGFSSAAGALRMSPGLVSRRLRHLEEELGGQLVNRSTRHIGLTEAGEAFYKECARALAVRDTARIAAGGTAAGDCALGAAHIADQFDHGRDAGARHVVALRFIQEQRSRMAGHCLAYESFGEIILYCVRATAETGVDRISAGAITHSARNLDIGLDF